MNIFVLDSDPIIAAQYHCNKHVVKMILESAQMLCTTHWLSDTTPQPFFFKPIFRHHPCTKWVRQSRQNYIWLSELALELCKEYTHRYNKIHSKEFFLQWLHDNIPSDLPNSGLTPFAQAMPDECKHPDAVVAYRVYYSLHKLRFAKYTKREIPYWLPSISDKPVLPSLTIHR